MTRTTPAPDSRGGRGLWLYLRARHVGWVAMALLLLTAASWWATGWLSTRTYFGGAWARPPVVGLSPLLAAVLVSATLVGADTDLDRTAPRITAQWRAVHATTAALIPTVLLALVATDTPQTFGSYALMRNSLGLTGIVLLTATIIPTVLAWAPALTYVLVAYLAAPRTPTAAAQWWAWPIQPGGPDPSWIVATSLLAAGLAAYTRYGPARTTS
ncbi:hypothetical protein [Pseudokineococcus sp. 1T1Z-3]|uniref:hypothetical protein n=1 Tax=Pseudokineococcus sp. 1T1Z-3 TaxID=3132745 RepID=UPI0030A9D8A5